MQAYSSVIRFHANIRALPLGSKHVKPIDSAPHACVGMAFFLRRVLDALVWSSAHRRISFLTRRCHDEIANRTLSAFKTRRLVRFHGPTLTISSKTALASYAGFKAEATSLMTF